MFDKLKQQVAEIAFNNLCAFKKEMIKALSDEYEAFLMNKHNFIAHVINKDFIATETIVEAFNELSDKRSDQVDKALEEATGGDSWPK